MSKVIPPIGPLIERLKDAFGVKKVPLASDFDDLINVADIGRKVAGLSPDQPPGQGQGMQLDENLRLAVLAQAAGGLNVNSTGVGITVEAEKGLAVGANGLGVQPGTGITVGSTGVSIDNTQLLVAGMIMMFSGAVAPAGWAFCDGADGRPDLRNRFILGGSGTDVKASGGSTIGGAGNAKAYSVNTNDVSAGNITVTIAGTSLTQNQIPSHNHIGGLKIPKSKSSYTQYGTVWTNTNLVCIGEEVFTGYMNSEDISNPYTSMAGGGEEHSHNGTATQGSHQHTITTLPAYYILAFIIKL